MTEITEGLRAVDRYKQTVQDLTLAFQQFALFANAIDDGDVKFVEETLRQADAVGWVVDPTAYRDAMYSGSLDRQKQLVDLFIKTKASLKKTFPDGWTS